MPSFAEWLKAIEEGYGPYIGPCVDTDRYQVQGACSQYNTDAQNKRISQGYVRHKKTTKKNKKPLTEQEAPAPVPAAPRPFTAPGQQNYRYQQKRPKWSASKDEVLDFWRQIPANTPIQMKPIDYSHKGSTFGEDGIRITGSPNFINSVISHLKDFLSYEGPRTKLAVSYRETESPSKVAVGQNKTSFVFYIAAKERGQAS
jgi:hypothetical protein